VPRICLLDGSSMLSIPGTHLNKHWSLFVRHEQIRTRVSCLMIHPHWMLRGSSRHSFTTNKRHHHHWFLHQRPVLLRHALHLLFVPPHRTPRCCPRTRATFIRRAASSKGFSPPPLEGSINFLGPHFLKSTSLFFRIFLLLHLLFPC
jgi:hypothetical protein